MKTRWIEVMIIVAVLGLLSFCFAAWDNDKPGDSDAIYGWPTSIRANWDALEAILGVDLDGDAGEFDVADIVVKGPWVDIRAHGAGTGESPADNAIAIQAAADSLTSGGTLLIPAGTFEYDTTLTVLSETAIVGVGRNVSILEFTAIDSTNAIEFKGAGADAIAGTPKYRLVMKDFRLLGNASSGHGIVIDIARHGILLFGIIVDSHGGDQLHIGGTLAASTANRFDSVDIVKSLFSGGTNGIYAGGGSGFNIYGGSSITGWTGDGVIIEDMSVVNIRDSQIASHVTGGSSCAVEVRTSASNQANEQPSIHIHISNIHSEGLAATDTFANIAPTGTTKLNSCSITNCDATGAVADFAKFSGYVKDGVVEGNTIYSGPTSGSVGVTIGANCEDINIGHNFWYDGVSISDSSAVGELHFSEEFDRSTTETSTVGAGEDDLLSTSIVADYLGIHGGLKVKAAGTKTGANDTKTIKLHFGASSWTVHAANNNTYDWRLEAEIFNTATNAQKISWAFYHETTISQGYETAAIDTTAAVTLKLTGECANAADAILQQFWVVDRF